MIGFIQGEIEYYGVDYIVVNCHDVGYRIFYAHTDQVKLHEKVKVYTYMHVSENDIALYGFSSLQEHDLFLMLIKVKGLGPKTAINMLAKSTYDRIVQAIESNDVTLLKSMPGIGSKTASQIVLDLKGKLIEVEQKSKKKYSQAIEDALEALKNLGYKGSEINFAANIMSEREGLTVEEYVKIGLQALLKQ